MTVCHLSLVTTKMNSLSDHEEIFKFPEVYLVSVFLKAFTGATVRTCSSKKH